MINFAILIILFACVFFLGISGSKSEAQKRRDARDKARRRAQRAQKKAEPMSVTVEFQEGKFERESDDSPLKYCDEKINEIFISGVQIHCKKKDAGHIYLGWVVPESSNPVDKKAMAILTDSGRKVGYVPAKILTSFRKWCDAAPCRCAILVIIEDGVLRGRCHAYHPVVGPNAMAENLDTWANHYHLDIE